MNEPGTTEIISLDQLSKKASEVVKDLFATKVRLPTFHSYEHIKELIDIAKELIEQYDLTEEEYNYILLAIWFYFSGFPSDHNDFKPKSLDNAEKFMRENGCDEQQISNVLHLMKEVPDNNSSLSLKILHDVLVSYKGRKSFFRKMEMLRIERESFMGKTYSDHDWERIVYSHLVNSTFLTDAGRNMFQKRKIKNISNQRSLIIKARKITTRKKTGKEFGRAVDTLYRSNYNNHISLSSIADGKANMMISINTIILSVIVTLSGAGFTFSGTFMVDHVRYTVPIFILLLGCLASVIFAILSARPKVTNVEVDMDAVEENRTSLLFFGNFVKVSLDEFVNYLAKLKKNQRRLYNTMSVDTYYLGKVLEKKYRMLTWSYNLFMSALILSVLTFTFIFFYTNA